jgi:hypothetical protein
MNHGNDGSKPHCGGCIFEHSGCRFTGISLTPVVSVKGIFKFLLKNDLRISCTFLYFFSGAGFDSI